MHATWVAQSVIGGSLRAREERCSRSGPRSRYALGIAQATKSDVTMRALKRLDHRLAAYDVPAVADFREALATL